MLRAMSLAVLFVGTFLAVAPPNCAQESRASIVGRVTDASGAVVPGAAVTATNQTTNVATRALCNSDGNYEILFLNPGLYRVTSKLAGFKTFQRDNIELRIGDRVGLDVVLQPGNVGEKVV